MVAVGRDYADVAPLRGVLTGGGGQRLEVTVTMVSPASVQVHSGPAPFGGRPGAQQGPAGAQQQGGGAQQ